MFFWFPAGSRNCFNLPSVQTSYGPTSPTIQWQTVLSWPHLSIQCLVYKYVEAYLLHYPTWLRGMCRKKSISLYILSKHWFKRHFHTSHVAFSMVLRNPRTLLLPGLTFFIAGMLFHDRLTTYLPTRYFDPPVTLLPIPNRPVLGFLSINTYFLTQLPLLD